MASRRISKEIIEGIEAAALECPLCLERYSTPKLLPCIHSFCLGCLEKWVKERKGKLSCPTCREVHPIPKGGLQYLKTNIFISGLLDYVATLDQKSVPTCSCKKEARFFCRDCDDMYCNECKDAHRRIKMTRGHGMMTLEEYRSIDPVEEFASKHVNCAKHSMPYQFFCDTCKKPVCVGCTQVEHPKSSDHQIIDVTDAFRAFSSFASGLVKDSDTKLNGFSNVVKELKETQSVLNANLSKCRADITQQADELHRLIDRRKEEQLTGLVSSHTQILKTLEAQVCGVEIAIAKLSGMRSITHNLANSPNQVMALMSSYDTCGKLDELLKAQVHITPRQSGALRYYPNKNVSEFLENEVAGQLRGQDRSISPDKTSIHIKRNIEDGKKKFVATVITRNDSNEVVYDMDANVIGLFGRTDSRQSDDIKMDEVNITDAKNGTYEFSGSYFAFDRCVLGCKITEGTNTYTRQFKFGGLYEVFTPGTKTFDFTS